MFDKKEIGKVTDLGIYISWKNLERGDYTTYS